MSSGRSFDLTAGVVLSVLGSVLVLLPENIYDLILNLALFIGFFNTIYQLVQYILKKKSVGSPVWPAVSGICGHSLPMAGTP